MQLLKLILTLIFLIGSRPEAAPTIVAAGTVCLPAAIYARDNALRPMASAVSNNYYYNYNNNNSYNHTAEKAYRRIRDRSLRLAGELGPADIVLGIPFINETDTIGKVLKVALQGIEDNFPDAKVVVVSYGEKEGRYALGKLREVLNEYPKVESITFLKRNGLIRGKGWSIRAMMEIADALNAHCLFLNADMMTGDKGLNPEWIKLLLEPILKQKAEIVLPKYIAPYYSGIISSNFICPLSAAVYGVKIPWPVSKEFAISRGMVAKLRDHLKNPDLWRTSVARQGINPWFIFQAISNEAEIRVVPVGLREKKGHHHRNIDERLKAAIETVFGEVERNSSWWLEKYDDNRSISSLAVLPPKKEAFPGIIELNLPDRARRYRRGFDIHQGLYEAFLPPEIFSQLRSLTAKPPREFDLSSETWAKVVYHFLLAYRFDPPSRQRIVEGLVPIYWARMITFTEEVKRYRSSLWGISSSEERESLVYEHVKGMVDDQIDVFIGQREFFIKHWREKTADLESYLPLADYYESGPGTQLIVPGQKVREDGTLVWARDIYKDLSDICYENFVDFIKQFGLSQFSSSEEIARELRKRMQGLEEGLNSLVLRGDLHKMADLKRIAKDIFSYVCPDQVLGLSNDSCRRILSELPPENLLDGSDLSALHSRLQKEHDWGYRDILTLTEWTENPDYRKKVNKWIRDNPGRVEFREKRIEPLKALGLTNETCRLILDRFIPRILIDGFGCGDLTGLRDKLYAEYGWDYEEIFALSGRTEEPGMEDYVKRVYNWMRTNQHLVEFEEKEIRPLVVDQGLKPFFSDLAAGEQTGFPRLVGRVVVPTLAEGRGGEFPMIRYLTTITKSIVELERFSEIWRSFGEDKEKILNSIEGHYGYSERALTAHLIFENGNQIEAERRLQKMAFALLKEPEFGEASRSLEELLSGYFCSLTVSDGGFVPCSMWTWASHSFKGGKGVPEPSLRVERDWISWQFLVLYLKEAGLGDERTIRKKIIELMGEGREFESLGVHLLGLTPEVEDALAAVKRRVEKEPKAGELHRLNKGEPILEPIKEHWWESKYVLNAGACRLKEKDVKEIGRIEHKGMIYIIYRAVGDDGVTSRLGLAWTRDGVNILGRLPFPVFWPQTEYEGISCKLPKRYRGCEDPRLQIFEDKIYMLYTAVDGECAQIALASISIENFLEAIEDSTERNWGKAWGGAWMRHGLVFPGYPDKDAVFWPELFEGQYVLLHRMEPGISASFHNRLECPWPRDGFKILIPPRLGTAWFSQRLGEGANPIKTKYGWLHIIHGTDPDDIYRLGVRVTALTDPLQNIYFSPNAVLNPETIYEKGTDGAPFWEKHNIAFTCGAVPLSDKDVLDEDDEVLVIYGAADTTICAAKAKVGELIPEEVRNRAVDLPAEGPEAILKKHQASLVISQAA